MNDDDPANVLLGRANIPRRYRELVDFDPRQHGGWAAAFDQCLGIVKGKQTGNIIVLCGNRGTGKTRLATELIQGAVRNLCFYCRYEVLQDYLDRLPRFNSPMGFNDHDDVYLMPRLLVLDEIAKAGDSAWVESRLFHIVNSRYNDLKHTILITAAQPQTIPDILGPSLIDRINEGGTIVHLDWPSFRAPPPAP